VLVDWETAIPMLGGIFHKRKKAHELRTPSLQDLKKFVRSALCVQLHA